MMEVIEEIDFVAEHPKADMSKVNTIRVNGKEYVSIDRVLEIIDAAINAHAANIELYTKRTDLLGAIWCLERKKKELTAIKAQK